MISGYTGERLLLTLWIGGLWAIGYLAVPIAFTRLDSAVAGDYAGTLFFAVNLLGVISAVILLASRVLIFGVRHCHRYWRSWLLLLMLALSLFFLLYLQPEMQHIRAQEWTHAQELAERFGTLHTLSENLYLLMSVLGLLLVSTTDKRAEARGGD